MANKVLVDIKSAAEKMEASAGSCMSSFVSFVDTQGDDLNKELNVHFDSLHSFFAAQNEELQDATHASSEYALRSEMEVMTSSGGTPKKRAFEALEQLQETRDHEVIKAEIRKFELPEDETEVADVVEMDIEEVHSDAEEESENCDPQRISSGSGDSIEGSKIRLRRESSVTRRRGSSSDIN